MNALSHALRFGCCVCGGVPEARLELRDRNVIVCRPCAAALGLFLELATIAFRSHLWGSVPPAHSGSDEERVLTAFKEKARATLSRSDAAAHYDLAQAYAEMGLASDAIQTFAIPLHIDSPHDIAQPAFEKIFASEHARPDALSLTISAYRAAQ